MQGLHAQFRLMADDCADDHFVFVAFLGFLVVQNRDDIQQGLLDILAAERLQDVVDGVGLDRFLEISKVLIAS